MRERARLRILKKQAGSCIGNNSLDVTETSVHNLDSNDSSKDVFDSSVSPSFLPDKTDAGKLAVRQEQQDFKVKFTGALSTLPSLHLLRSKACGSSTDPDPAGYELSGSSAPPSGLWMCRKLIRQ